ncbi:MAG: hypothetical protein M1358_02160 [Chloroflexi bacterium]|nr:hypothetical protein [Chloroflexota bacterium]
MIGDRDRIEQIFLSLIQKAIEYSPRGGPEDMVVSGSMGRPSSHPPGNLTVASFLQAAVVDRWPVWEMR